MTGYS